MTTDPPDDADFVAPLCDPAIKYKFDPLPEDESPTPITIPPDFPFTEAPEVIDTMPELPEVVIPVEISTSPDTPVVPAFAVAIKINPLLPAVLAPELTTMEPPDPFAA